MHVYELETTERRTVGTSGWIDVTQTMIDLFARATGDHGRLDVSSEQSARDRSVGPVAQGHLLLAMVPQMVEEVLDLQDRTMGVNYGVNRLRFTDAVPGDSRVRGTVSVIRGDRRRDGGILSTLELLMEREGSSRPAMIAELLTLSYGPPSPRGASNILG